MVRRVPQATLNKWSDRKLLARLKRLKKENLKVISNFKISETVKTRRRWVIALELSKTQKALNNNTAKQNKKMGMPPPRKRPLFRKVG
jgi:hypothetical protein